MNSILGAILIGGNARSARPSSSAEVNLLGHAQGVGCMTQRTAPTTPSAKTPSDPPEKTGFAGECNASAYTFLRCLINCAVLDLLVASMSKILLIFTL
jgi:hypothetical protein